jgi:hypothetical protein
LLSTLFPLKSAASAFDVVNRLKLFFNTGAGSEAQVRLERMDRRLDNREDIRTGTQDDNRGSSQCTSCYTSKHTPPSTHQCAPAYVSRLYNYLQQEFGSTSMLKWDKDRQGPDHIPTWSAWVSSASRDLPRPFVAWLNLFPYS